MDEQPHRRSHTTQAIPLQDLNRPPEQPDIPQEGSHRRTLSERGRMLFARSSSRQHNSRYAALAEDSPLDHTDAPHLHRTDSSSNDDTGDDADVQEGTPMVSHPATFQDAVGFAGLSFESHPSSNPLEASSLPYSQHALGNLVGNNESDLSLADVSLDFGRDESPTIVDDDRVRLTDVSNIQAVDGAAPSAPRGQRHNRLSSQTVRFTTPSPSPRPSHLGDDLSAMESGSVSPRNRSRRKSSISRSLSPSSAVSPLARASTVVRKMSQRVVNLSNEQDVVEQEIRRRGSQRRREEDEASTQQADNVPSPSEKLPQPASTQPSLPGDWVRFANPLRGRSLGIFPPGQHSQDNALRLHDTSNYGAYYPHTSPTADCSSRGPGGIGRSKRPIPLGLEELLDRLDFARPVFRLHYRDRLSLYRIWLCRQPDGVQYHQPADRLEGGIGCQSADPVRCRA